MSSRSYRTRRSQRNRRQQSVQQHQISIKRPVYTQQEDVEDWLDEDEEVTIKREWVGKNQKFWCASFAVLDDDSKQEIIERISQEQNQSVKVVSDIVNSYLKEEMPKRGVKNRGNFPTLEEVQQYAQKLRSSDRYFHVFLGEVGKWCPASPDPENQQDENYQENQLNELVKGIKINKEKSDRMYKDRKAEMVRKAMIEGTKQGQQMLMEQSEPVVAVEERVRASQETIGQLEEKLKEAQRAKELAEKKLEYMKEQEAAGKVYPTLEEYNASMNVPTIDGNQQQSQEMTVTRGLGNRDPKVHGSFGDSVLIPSERRQTESEVKKCD